MKNNILLGIIFFIANTALAQNNFCAQYAAKPTYLTAISKLATEMNYTFEQLCSLSTLGDIQVVPTALRDENYQPVNHVWVTLHYETYSCQYFVRDADQIIIRENCYNTW